MHRRRRGKLKIEHHLLEGLEKFLSQMALWDTVEAIIPGRIVRQGKGRGRQGLFLKYRTVSGYKLLYKKGTSVQEVFVVCTDHERFERAFREVFG